MKPEARVDENCVRRVRIALSKRAYNRFSAHEKRHSASLIFRYTAPFP